MCVTVSNLTLAVRFGPMHTAYTAPTDSLAAPAAPVIPRVMDFGGPVISEAQQEFLEMKRVLETAYAASGGTVTDADVWMALGKEPPAPKE